MKIKLLISLLLVIALYGESISQIKIGVALPLMNNSENKSDKSLGAEIFQGINDAVKEHNKNHPNFKVDIITEDTKRDPGVTLDIINKFGSNKNVIAVFGPVFSSELSPNSGAAAFHKMPVVTPTSTQSFLADNNEYLFQLNPTYDIRGRTMAKFALNNLNMKSFAIFSEDNYGKNFADSFESEIVSNGGEVSVKIFYSKDDNDLTQELEEMEDKIFSLDKFIDFGNINAEQFEKIKNSELKFSYADSLKDAGLIVSIYKLYGRNALRIIDSLKILTSVSIDRKKTVLPGFIEAIYIPISTYLEIPKMISQYFSEHINLPVLGTSDWNNKDVLEENKMYIKNLYIDSDFNLSDDAVSPPELSESGVKNYYFGYDGMKLLLDKIAEGNKSRALLNEALENTEDYKTNHNIITLKNRTNHNLVIMRFRKGELQKIGDFTY